MSERIKKISIALLLCFMMVLLQVLPNMGYIANAEGAFTGASGKSGNLDWNITADGHLTISGSGDYQSVHMPPWTEYSPYIYTATINVNNITSTKYMFQDCSNLKSIDVRNLDVSRVTNMQQMFLGCSSLTSLDVSNFDTSNAKCMTSMFMKCSSLTSLDVSKFNTSQVTDMEQMFMYCSNLTSLDVSGFNTSNVESIASMFADCDRLTSLDVSNFDTKQVKYMSQLFASCIGLTHIDVSNFDTRNLESTFGMFSGCRGLTSLDLSGFNTSKVTSMACMFVDCSNLVNLDISNLDTSQVTDMSQMFERCYNLTSLNISNFDTSNVEDMSYMFGECDKLTNLDVSNFNTSNVTDMGGMFNGCSVLKDLDLSKFDTNKTIDMSYMFNYCESLENLDLSNFNVSNVTNMDYIFRNMRKLKKLCFFANSPIEAELPSMEGYHWENEKGETCTVAIKGLNSPMVYTKVSNFPLTPAYTDHLFYDYEYNNPVSGSSVIIYGNGIKNKIENTREFTVYTDILASYNYTENNNKIKSSTGKVIVGITESNIKPAINKNKIQNQATNIAKAKITNGQITVTATGKKAGLVYLWVIDTGNKGVSECCPINVYLAPKKIEIQGALDSKLTAQKLAVNDTLDVKAVGFVGSENAIGCTYNATVDNNFKSYVEVTAVPDTSNQFTVKAKGLKNNKNTKASIIFVCNENGKKVKFPLTVTK